jgi:hypothetical protein
MPNFNVLNGILFNKYNKIKQKKQQNKQHQQQQQPIKLQIELPFNQFFNSNDEDGYSVGCDGVSSCSSNKTLDLTTTMTKRSKNVNHISLHISFDGGSKMSINENSTKRVTRKSIKIQNGSTTSGYSSSIAEIICNNSADRRDDDDDDDNCSDRGDLFCKKESTISHKNEIEEHIYDKLNYINNTETEKLKSKRRHSLSSSSNSSSGSSLARSYYQLSKNNDYEEICNFSQVTSTPARIDNKPILLENSLNETYTYETLYNCKSSSIKRIRKINRKFIKEEEQKEEEDSFENNNNISFNSTIINNKYKREYSVNEIFQNLEVFKKQAKEGEDSLLKHHNNNNKFEIQKPPASKSKPKRHNYINDKIS